jgi:uncharacterized protein (TIGR02145 family)
MKRFLVILSLFLIGNISFSQTGTQNIKLSEGWNLFSTYIQPASPAISNVLSTIISNVIIVKDGGGDVYWPQYNVNNIGNMGIGEGYQVKILNTVNLAVTGTQLLPENTPIYIPIGWSMLGYLRIWPQNIDTALASIKTNIQIMKDENGNTYWPAYGVNDITYLIPGKGYHIKMLIADTLTYSANSFNCGSDVISDYDGNIYNTVIIGSKCLIKENLNIGSMINTYQPQMNNSIIEKYCYNDNPNNCNIYGGFYQWDEMMQYCSSSNFSSSSIQGICPTHWHIPSKDEWNVIIDSLGGTTIAGGKMKSTGTIENNNGLWYDPNSGATNESGFTGFPSGGRNNEGAYNGLGLSACFHTSTDYNSIYSFGYTNAWCIGLEHDTISASNLNGLSKFDAISLRCIMDDIIQESLPILSTIQISYISQTSASSGGEIANDGGSFVSSRGICWNTTGNPTISDYHTSDGAGQGYYTSSLTGLISNTMYYVRSYAINGVGIAYGIQVSFTTSSTPSFSCPITTITDYDGNTYNTVTIGNQCWMKENLKTTHYRNGTSLAYPGSNNTEWVNNTSGAYAWYNDNINYKDIYGALYNSSAVTSSNGLCPTGWHVPSSTDWNFLISYLGGQYVAGGKLKETGNNHWIGPNVANNESWFTALPGGQKVYVYFEIGKYGHWWVSSGANNYICEYYSPYIYSQNSNGQYLGFSVRCIKD